MQRNLSILGIFAQKAYTRHDFQFLNTYGGTLGNRLEEDLNHPSLSKLRRWLEAHLAG